MVLCIINVTALQLMTSAIANPWKILHFFQMLCIAVVISAQIAVESFYAYSAFIGAYQCFMILEANGKTTFTIAEILKMYLRKYLRLAPCYYILLFAGWNSCSRISDGPLWSIMRNLWFDCDTYWWSKLLFIGNIYGF